MKATVKTEDFARIVARVATACEVKIMSIPVLGSVRIEAKEDGTLSLATTNLDLFIRETLKAEVVKKPGVAVVGVKVLRSFMSRGTASTTSLEMKDLVLKVKHGENEGVFESLKDEDFPPIPHFEGEDMFCSYENFVEPMARVAHAMSSSEARYVLMSVCVKPIKENQIDFVATDGARMSVCTTDAPFKCKGEMIVPDATVRTVVKLIESGSVTVRTNDVLFGVRNGGLIIVSRLTEGKYPGYRMLIPERTDKCFHALRSELIEAVQTAALFLRNKEICVTLAGRKKEIEVSCFDRFNGRVLGSDLGEQPDVTINCNVHSLLDALNEVRGEVVRIELADKQPIALRDAHLIEIMNPLIPNANAPTATEP